MKRLSALFLTVLMVFGLFAGIERVHAEEGHTMSFRGATELHNPDGSIRGYEVVLKVGEELSIFDNVLFDGETLSKNEVYFIGPLNVEIDEEGEYQMVDYDSDLVESMIELDTTSEHFILKAKSEGALMMCFNCHDIPGKAEANEYGFDLFINIIKPVDIKNADVIVENQVYTGKELCPEPEVNCPVEDDVIVTLEKDTDYTVSYKNNVNAGKATVIIKGIGRFTGTKKETFKIAKADQKLKAKGKTVKVKAKTLKSKKVTLKPSKTMTIKGAKGKLTYKKVSGSKKLTINKKTGKITVKKGTKKGTYAIKVKVTSAKTSNYKAASKTVKVTVKVVK